ncbi:PspC domain-containing protein [Alkaliphilus peptidifermentans]|uniref:Phage shock protein C (PspC) family protein n=1 Tax=Alkaliphilus peptidifermentans DSM 18978 TaxID=1120976 RepID=A0A1G5K0G2_9FIRM|nr:PspC domain-containing protein [Alkaliphilus peptidifermentans]SCY93590.1 phage shock protein C (PspC) family protein [Alkaliphilus peptidifermentans DSM 18978]
MKKRLYLSKDKQLAGVCGGVAEYFDVDPTIVRLLWVLFTFTGGAGLIVYVIAAIIMTERPISYNSNTTAEYYEADKSNDDKRTGTSRNENNNIIIGLGLVAAGGLMFSKNIFGFHWLSIRMFWPVVLIAIGFYVIINGRK